MAKLSISLASIMGDRDMSISSSPFAPGKVIIKRASFPKGIVPAHLEKYLIRKGECAGQTGKSIGPRGQPVPNTAICVANKHGGRKRGRKAAAE